MARHISLATAAAFRLQLTLDVGMSSTIGLTAARTDTDRGRAVDPVADCLRCRLASVTDAALMLLRSRRCLELVGAPWWCLGIFSWTKRAIYMASESAAVATSISRARLGVIVCACIFVGLRSTDGHAPCVQLPGPWSGERWLEFSDRAGHWRGSASTL